MPAVDSSAAMEAVPGGFRCVLTDGPRNAASRGAVVFAPPFAEEMNKSRRMVALAARALAAEGWRVLRTDLYGCGDSSGDFADANWSDWLDDLRRSVDVARRGGGELWLWGLRAGALLLPPLLDAVPEANLLLWQPSASGSAVLNQFLRLKAAAALTGAVPAGDDRQSLLQRLACGEAVEVAGYRVSAALATGLDAARLDLPAAHRGRVVLIEVAAADVQELSPGSMRLVEGWRLVGRSVEAICVQGPQFWQTVETSEAPALITSSVGALGRAAAGAAAAGHKIA